MSLPQQSDHAFGLTFVVVFAAITAIGWFGFGSWLPWAAAICAIFLALALAAPWLLMPLNRLWGRFAFRVSLLSNFLILGLFFYIFVLTFGLILRLFGNDPMSRSMDPKKKSYWMPVGRNALRARRTIRSSPAKPSPIAWTRPGSPWTRWTRSVFTTSPF